MFVGRRNLMEGLVVSSSRSKRVIYLSLSVCPLTCTNCRQASDSSRSKRRSSDHKIHTQRRLRLAACRGLADPRPVEAFAGWGDHGRAIQPGGPSMSALCETPRRSGLACRA